MAALAGWRRVATGGLIAVLVLGASVAASAQFVRRPAVAGARQALPAIPDTQVVPPTSVLGIISGGLSGTYIRIAADVASVFSEHAPQLRILPIVGKGSSQNVSDIMNIRDVDIGIVQSDVLSFLRQKASLAGIETKVSYLAKLYDEEVHLLARDEIGNVNDLNGKKVSVDAKGSGTSLTAAVIFDALGVRPIIVNDDPETALTELRSGKIDALVYVTGKPARLFTDAGTGLHLLALPLNSALLQTYLPSRFEHSDYPSLVPEGGSVETVAVGAVMAVYNWAPGTERYTRLTRFVDAFFDNIPALQQPPHHPKWKQVSLTAQVPGWTRFPEAQLWLDRHGSQVAAPAPAKP